MQLRIREARTMGQDHRAVFKNCHDAKSTRQFEIAGTNYSVGVVCDGCGEGLHSEVGSNLIANFVPRALQRLLFTGCAIDDPGFFGYLYDEVVAFLSDLIVSNNFTDKKEETDYIKDHLLATVVGFISDGEKIAVFNAGDGLVVHNDELFILDQNNKPMYIAYQLVNRQYLSSNASTIPNEFEVKFFEIDDDFERIIIGTDGIIGVNGEELDIIPRYRGMRKENSLQRKFNVWSDIERRFKDDATAILVERIPDDEE